MRDVVLGWDKDGTRVELPAFLKDVSMSGCKATSSVRPRARLGDPIWFGLAGSDPADWLEGILIDAKKPFLQECTIRIKFLDPLPYAMYKYLVYGPQHEEARKNQVRECETDQFWR